MSGHYEECHHRGLAPKGVETYDRGIQVAQEGEAIRRGDPPKCEFDCGIFNLNRDHHTNEVVQNMGKVNKKKLVLEAFPTATVP